MKLASVWTSIVQVFNVLTFSAEEGDGSSNGTPQVPISLHHAGPAPPVDSGPWIPPITKDEAGNFFRGDKPLVQEYGSAMVYDPDRHKTVPLRTGGQERSFAHMFRDLDHPIVGTPKNGQDGENGGLLCEYEAMKGWESCYGPEDRSCWLRRGDERIDINTDYENPAAVPVGQVRHVRLWSLWLSFDSPSTNT
jgi:hypothetical protein